MTVRHPRRPTAATAVVALVLCAGWATARQAQAQIDMSGDWYVQGNVLGENGVLVPPRPYTCTLAFVQTGMALTVSGSCGELGALSLSGTVDPGTGGFLASGSAGGACALSTTTVNGTATADNKSFSGLFRCPDVGIALLAGTMGGTRCGNGVIEPLFDENCDDGNNAGFDCCDSNCTLDPGGAQCLADDNQCTDDVCDGAGLCTHPDRVGPCDNGEECSTDDTCVAGSCVGTPLPNGSPCDDFDTCTDESCQAGSCAATQKPDGGSCEDGSECTAGETCLAGACGGGAAVVCPACMTCNEGVGCEGDPFSYVCTAASEDAILMKSGGRDLVKWKWTPVDELAIEDLGNPPVDTPYELCVFDQEINPGTGGMPVLFSASAPTGSGWHATGSGFRFKGADKLKARLKSGAPGKAKLIVKAAGPPHDVVYLPPISNALFVQLRTPRDVLPQRCFAAEYFIPTTSTGAKYKSENPLP